MAIQFGKVHFTFTASLKMWGLLLIVVRGQAFVLAYCAEEVTTYIHIFVYHYRYFLYKYNSLEKFSNYTLESKHSVVKRILAHSTLRFSNGQAEAAHQQLAALIHNELHNRTSTPTTTAAAATTSTTAAAGTKHKHSWAQSHLGEHVTIKKFVDSPHYI